MTQDESPLKQKKSKFDLGVAAAILSALCFGMTVIAAFYANHVATTNNENNVYHTFQQTLSQLNGIEQKALSAKESSDHGSCTGGGCLGSLALGETYFNQYELLAEQAMTLATQIESRMSDSDRFELANALYTAGRLNDCESYIGAAERSTDPLIRFRAKLLRAQVAFIREDMAAGRSAIDEALKYISGNSFGLSEAEIRLKKAQAHLICATMQLALGKPEEAHTCMKDAYEMLQTVPQTPRRHQLDEMLENLMRSYINSKNGTRPKTFEEYEKEFGEPQPAPVRPKAPAEAGS